MQPYVFGKGPMRIGGVIENAPITVVLGPPADRLLPNVPAGADIFTVPALTASFPFAPARDARVLFD